MNQGYTPPTAEHVELYREALDVLVKSPGWALVLKYMQGQKQFALNGMLAAGTQPHEIARSAGAFAQLTELESWPQRNRDLLTSQLNALKKGK